MPCFDGTGPMGQGSQTGRGKGRCRNDQSAENTLTVERGAGRGSRMRSVSEDREATEKGNWRGRGQFAGRTGRLHRRKNQ